MFDISHNYGLYKIEEDYCWSLSRDRVSGTQLYRFMIWPRDQNFNKPVISALDVNENRACKIVLDKLGDQKPYKDK